MTFSAVLFDWRGTLYYEMSTAQWIQAGAASLGRHIDDPERTAMASRIAAAAALPEVVAAQDVADCSSELNKQAALLQLGLAGLDEDLALAIWQQDGEIGTSLPYADTARVLQAIKQRGVRVAVVSDIHYELTPHFAAHSLDDCVDLYVLSYQFGIQKPDARLFQAALDGLDVSAAEALMVGDRPARDGGGVALGITTLILPPVANGGRRGLDIALNLV